MTIDYGDHNKEYFDVKNMRVDDTSSTTCDRVDNRTGERRERPNVAVKL